MTNVSVIVVQENLQTADTELFMLQNHNDLTVSFERISKMMLGADPFQVRGNMVKSHLIGDAVLLSCLINMKPKEFPQPQDYSGVSRDISPESITSVGGGLKSASVPRTTITFLEQPQPRINFKMLIAVGLLVSPNSGNPRGCDLVYQSVEYVSYLLHNLGLACQAAIPEVMAQLRIQPLQNGRVELPRDCLKSHVEFNLKVSLCISSLQSYFNPPMFLEPCNSISTAIDVFSDLLDLHQNMSTFLSVVVTAVLKHHTGWVAAYASQAKIPLCTGNDMFVGDRSSETLSVRSAHFPSASPTFHRLTWTVGSQQSTSIASGLKSGPASTAGGYSNSTFNTSLASNVCKFLILCKDDTTARKFLSVLSYFVRSSAPIPPGAVPFEPMHIIDGSPENLGNDVLPIHVQSLSQDMNCNPAYTFAESESLIVPFVACRVLRKHELKDADILEFVRTPGDPSHHPGAYGKCIVIDVDRLLCSVVHVPPAPHTLVRRAACTESDVITAALHEIAHLCHAGSHKSLAVHAFENIMQEIFLSAVALKELVESINPENLPLSVQVVLTSLHIPKSHLMNVVSVATFLSSDIRGKLKSSTKDKDMWS